MSDPSDIPPAPRPDVGPPPLPRWVKIFGALVLLFVVIFIGRHLAGGGMRRHMNGGSAQTSP